MRKSGRCFPISEGLRGKRVVFTLEKYLNFCGNEVKEHYERFEPLQGDNLMSWEEFCEELVEYGSSLGLPEDEVREILEENEWLFQKIRKTI